MRIHPLDSLLFLSMKIMKAFDRRETALASLDPSRIRNILVVSSTALGDTLLSTPAFRAVRERYPEATIMAHLNVKNLEIFENNPHIDGIIPYYNGYRRFFSTVREFRRYRFDMALIFHGNEPQATPMAYLSGARFIVKIPRSRQYGFLLSNPDDGFDNPWDHHAIDVRLRAASMAGCSENSREMVLLADKDDETSFDAWLREHGEKENELLVCFQAGAATRFKMWPKEMFAELGRRLVADRPDVKIILTGSRDEHDLCSFISRELGAKAISAAGELTLRQMRGLMKRVNLLVTNDTGTMHMAIALKTRTVSLFCPTNSWGVGPVQDPELHNIISKERPCNPCVTKKCPDPFCMKLITVDEVYEAVMGLLPALGAKASQ